MRSSFDSGVSRSGGGVGGGPSEAEFDVAPLDASLSSSYLARRFARSQGTNGAHGSLSPSHMRPGASPGYDRSYAPPAPVESSSSVDADYRLESLQLMLSSFKTKMRADFDATFTSVERKSRTQRKEILAHVTASLEEVETRLAASLKSNLGDYQLLEIEFRKNLKADLYTLRNEMEAAVRNEEDLRTEMARKLKLQESVAVELRQKLEELMIGRAGGSLHTAAGSMHFDQQLVSFQHALDALQTKFGLELLSHRKESEMKNVDLAHQILDLRRIVDSLITNEEASQRAQDETIRANGEKVAVEIQARVDESLTNMSALLKNLYRNLEMTTQNQDVLHAQLNELQAKDNGTGPPQTRKVTQAQLDSVEEKLMGLLHGPGGGVQASTIRDLQTSVDLHTRKLDQLQSSARESLDESDVRMRIVLDKFRSDLSVANDGRLSNLTLDVEIVKRKIELIQPEVLQQQLTSKMEAVEKELVARLSAARDEVDRSARTSLTESAAARERHQSLERRTDDLTALVQQLSSQVKDFTTSASRVKDESTAREKKHLQDLFDLREKHAADLHALRREMEDVALARERDARDEIARAVAKAVVVNEEKHAELVTKLRDASDEHAKAHASLNQTLSEDLSSTTRRLDTELHRIGQAVAEVDQKSRRAEEVMRVAEDLARTGSKPEIGVPNAELQAVQGQLAALQLQVKLLTEKQEQILRNVADSLVSQTSLQTSVAASQREVERALATARQADVDTLTQSQRNLSHARGELETALAAVDARLTKDANEVRARVEDVEHGMKIAKRYRDDNLLSPRGTDGPAGDVAGAPYAKESALRPIQLQLEEVEFKVHSLTQNGAQLKLAHADLAPRVDSLERELGDVRKRALQRDASVDEALRGRLDMGTFDKFRREFTAQSQSQQAATLSAAQTALATAQQAQHKIEQQQQQQQSAQAPWSDAAAPSSSPSSVPSLPSSSIPFVSPSPPLVLSPPLSVPASSTIRAVGRASSSSSGSGSTGNSNPSSRANSVSPKSVLRRVSLDKSLATSSTPKSVHFADVAEPSRAAIEPILPTLAQVGSFEALQPFLETGHRMLKHFSHGPPISKLVFYSARALPNASTGVVPSVPAIDAEPGFIHWVEPDDASRGVLPMTTLMVSRITALAAGKQTRAFLKHESAAVQPDLCFSVLTADRSLEVQTTSRDVRDAWVRGVAMLLRKHQVHFTMQGDAAVITAPDEVAEREQSKGRQEEEDEDDDDNEEDLDSSVEVDTDADSSRDLFADVDAEFPEDGATASPTKAPPATDSIGASSIPPSSSAAARELELARLESERAQRIESELARARAQAELDAEARIRSEHAAEAEARKKKAEAELQRVREERLAEEAAAAAAKKLKQQQEAEAAEQLAAAQAKTEREAREAAEEAARRAAALLAEEQAERDRQAAARQAAAEEAERERQVEAARQAELFAAQERADAEHAALMAQKARALEEERTRLEAERIARERQQKLAAEAEAEAKRLATIKAEQDAAAAQAKAAAAAIAKADEDRRQRAAEAAERARIAASSAPAARIEHHAASDSGAASLAESEEDEDEYDEDDDDRPEWLDARDIIIQLTLRAQCVPRIGVISQTELVYHISPIGPNATQNFFVTDRHQLHGLDEEEMEEYAAEHPDCLNGIFDLRYGFVASAASAPRRVRIRIYDVLQSSPTARIDNLVGEINDIDLDQLLRSGSAGVAFTPKHPTKTDMTQRMQDTNTSVLMMARVRRNLRERRAAGLESAPEAQTSTSRASTSAHPPPPQPPAPAARRHASDSDDDDEEEDDDFDDQHRKPYHEKGESDDDLNLSFSPADASRTESAAARPAPPSAAPPAAAAPASRTTAVGSMMGGGSSDETSDDESEDEFSSAQPPPPPPAAASRISAQDEWDAIDAHVPTPAAPAPSVTSATASRYAAASGDDTDDDDDVSDESDDDAPAPTRSSALPSYTLRPTGTSSRAAGGLASALLGRSTTAKTGASSSAPATSASRANFKIGMRFGDDDDEEEEEEEEDDEEDQPRAPAPSAAHAPVVLRTTAPSMPRATHSIAEEEENQSDEDAWPAPPMHDDDEDDDDAPPSRPPPPPAASAARSSLPAAGGRSALDDELDSMGLDLTVDDDELSFDA